MKEMSIYTISLGCPKNLVDTEKILGRLDKYYSPAQELEHADLVLINTCSFIQPAVEESIQNILDISNYMENLQNRPKLVVTGCLVARYGSELEKELPEVDLWVDLNEQEDLVDKFARKFDLEIGTEVEPGDTSSRTNRVLSTSPGYSYLKISEGCPHNCNFCLIPQLRGKLQSESIRDLRMEAENLLSCGVKELCLVAQDVTSYGRDLGLKDGLRQLLREMVELDGLYWLRLMYLYPVGITSGLLYFFTTLGPKFKPYFDIPLQHAHPDLLKSMGRPFAQDPEKVISAIRRYFPDASIRTTFIVGYPGETEGHFQTLLDFVREARFEHVGVFSFYPEQGTRAAEMAGQVPEEVKESRRQELLQLQASISEEKLASYVDTWQEVLIDKKDPEWPTLYQGRTWFQAPEIDGITYVSAHDCQPGDMVWAKIEESKIYDLIALV